MPTPKGLPKAGEIWQRTWRLPPDWQPNTITFKVLERTGGDYWAVRVQMINPPRQAWEPKTQLFVDVAYWFSKGELTYIRKA